MDRSPRKLPVTEPPPDSVRSCGECQACCVVHAVYPNNDREEGGACLTKAFETCQFQVDEGCSIYEHRPSPCAAYHCMWRLGWGRDDDRPDRLGLVFEGSEDGVLYVAEVRPGVWNTDRNIALLDAFYHAEDSPASLVVIVPWGTEDHNRMRDSILLNPPAEALERLRAAGIPFDVTEHQA